MEFWSSGVAATRVGYQSEMVCHTAPHGLHKIIGTLIADGACVLRLDQVAEMCPAN